MPKISGENIAEHVAAQGQAVFDTAIRLFGERGVANVTTGDIASEVGLARTSIYRYFPTKASIVHRWFEEAMPPLVAAATAIADAPLPRAEQLQRWVDLQLDFLVDDNNHAMIQASRDTGDMPDDILTAIGRRHRDLYASLHRIVADEDTPEPATATRVLLIAMLLRDLVDLTTKGIPIAVARAELQRATALIAGTFG